MCGAAKERQKAEIITELRQTYKLQALLSLAALPRSTYYYHSKPKKDKYRIEKQEIQAIFDENHSRYGYRRVECVLRQQGYALNHKTVLKLMKSLGLQGKTRKNKYRSYKGEVGKVAENIISQSFIASAPYEKLTTDVSEFAVCGEKIYLSPVLDMYSNEIIACSISKSPSFAQTREMLKQLFAKLPKGATPVLHSDQGWQYRMKEYQQTLDKHNIVQSMSRKGNCLDNSIMESFFGRLKTEMFFGETFQSADELIRRLEEYLDYYNNSRVSLKLKGLTPIQYRNQSMSI